MGSAASNHRLNSAYRQAEWTLIRLLLEERSDQGPHCLQQICFKRQVDETQQIAPAIPRINELSNGKNVNKDV